MAYAHAPDLIPWLFAVAIVALGVGVPVTYMYVRSTAASISGRRD